MTAEPWKTSGGGQRLAASADAPATSDTLVKQVLAKSQGLPDVVAAQLWCFVHGYITLELGGHFDDRDDPVAEVLVPMAVNFAVALGDDPARSEASHRAALLAEAGRHEPVGPRRP